MNLKRVIELLKRRFFSPCGVVVLMVAASFGYRFVRAQAADVHRQPYKYELIEEFGGIRIVRGFIDPVLDMTENFIEKDGEREPIKVYTLAEYVNRKYAGQSVDAKIGHFVRLFNPSTVKIIESVADIPGYAPDQLDPDINPDAIRTWTFTIQRGRLDKTHPQDCIVKYAWEVMGDIQRFRFRIYGSSNEITVQEVAVVQTQVGDFRMLD